MTCISKRLLLLACAVIGLRAAPALASPLTFDFSGVLDGAIGTISSGTAYSGAVTYDLSAFGTTVAYHNGQQTTYTGQPLSVTATIGGVTITASSNAYTELNNNLNIAVPVSYPNGDNLFLYGNTQGGPTWGGVVIDDLYLSLNDSTGAVFSGNNLPASLSFGSFTSTLFGLNYNPLGAGNVNLVSPLSTLGPAGPVYPIPEPSAAALLALGMLGLGLFARRAVGV